MQGYSCDKIGKKTIEKKEGFEEVLEKDSEILEKAKKAIEAKGDVFVIKQKKVIKAIYLFEQEIIEEKKKVLKLVYELKLEGIPADVIEHYENDILEVIKENISLGDIYKLEWEGKEIEKSYMKIGNQYLPFGFLILFATLIISIYTNQVWIFLIGLLAALSGGVVVNESKKNEAKKRKAEDNNSNDNE